MDYCDDGYFGFDGSDAKWLVKFIYLSIYLTRVCSR